MRQITFSLLSFALLGALGSVACSDGEDSEGGEGGAGAGDSGASYECYDNDACGTDEECSGGSCVVAVACETGSECGDDESCFQDVCRQHCTTDAGCANVNGTCDLAENLCMSSENPEPGATPGGDGDAPGGDGDAPGGDGDTDPGAPPEPTYDVIDDFLDGDQAILMNEGRQGYWYDYSDAGSSRPLASAPEMHDGRQAVHAVGSHLGGVSADEAFGGLGVELNNASSTDPVPGQSPRGTFDASAWDGIQVWVKSGTGATKSVRLEMVTPAIAEGSEGGSCTSECWDAYGRDIAITTEWKLAKIPFSSLVQEGWGGVKSLEVGQILGLAFEDRTTSPWDFWVGEISFYKDPPPVDGGMTDPGGGGSCSGAWGGYTDASITKYWFTQGTTSFGDINCSFGISNVGTQAGGDSVNHVSTGGGSFFGAMNTADYNNAAACGACAEVTADNGKSVVITIADQCPIASNPLCTAGHIDLSVDAYNALGLPVGHYGKGAQGQVGWKYVPCPTAGGIQLRLKEPNNRFWNMVIVENHTYPIAKVEVETDRGWLQASREEFNFWLPPGGNIGNGNVRITDVNGTVVSGSVSPAGGTAPQLMCQ